METERHAEYRRFATSVIAPRAATFDQNQCVPREVIHEMADGGLLCSMLPRPYGSGESSVGYGLLHEEIGACCSSLRSMLTVHDMVAASIWRWGADWQQQRYLPALRSASVIGAFALTEPEAGSDSSSISCTAIERNGGFELSGRKMWITSAQIAGLFLVFAKVNGQHAAFLVDRESDGLEIAPVSGLLGLRASMVGELRFRQCYVPATNVLGSTGSAFTHVAQNALDLGRYAVACGCVGLARACAEAASDYASQRIQFGATIDRHQLIRRMITNMLVNVEAARLLCREAGLLRDQGDAVSIYKTAMAKYFSSRVASEAASDAVQIHGGNGCAAGHPVGRFFRDAKVMEIIEGTNEIHQINIATAAAALLHSAERR